VHAEVVAHAVGEPHDATRTELVELSSCAVELSAQ
jgi:hypothetical protein